MDQCYRKGMKTIFKSLLLCLLTLSTALAADKSCDVWMNKLKASIKDPAALQVLIAKLDQLEIDCSNPEAAEKQLFDALWELETKKKLDRGVMMLVKELKKSNKVPALQKMNDQTIQETLALSIRSEFYDRGYYNRNFVFSGWDSITASQEKLLNSLPRVTSFNSSAFSSVFSHLTGMQMTSVSNTQVLGRNGEAFQKRVALVRAAKKSIKLATWGFYDDSIGEAFADELLKAHRRNIDVKILVDYQVAQRPGYHDQLVRLEKSGIELIGWKSTNNPFHGMHSKMLIVDDLYCIEGGRNIGEAYLMDSKWTDLDVYHEGAIAEVINPNLFASLWNDQIKLQGRDLKPLSYKDESKLPRGNVGTFLSQPQNQTTDPVSNLTIFAIMNARSVVEITNAYFISTPGIRKALIDAIARGVKVRIYSNSMSSVDEPIVSIPIQRSLQDMFYQGAEIYMKQGQTLHTKIFRADDLCWYGSYNLHPRSGRYELEKVTISTNKELNDGLERAVDETLQKGRRVTDAQELSSPQGPGVDLLFQVIFNQL